MSDLQFKTDHGRLFIQEFLNTHPNDKGIKYHNAFTAFFKNIFSKIGLGSKTLKLEDWRVNKKSAINWLTNNGAVIPSKDKEIIDKILELARESKLTSTATKVLTAEQVNELKSDPDIDIEKWCTTNGVDINAKSDQGTPLFHILFLKQNYKGVEWLLSHNKLDLNAIHPQFKRSFIQSMMKQTFKSEGFTEEQSPILELFLKHPNFNPNIIVASYDESYKGTDNIPLIHALYNNIEDPSLLLAIIDNPRLDLDAKYTNGKNLLERAFHDDKTSIIEKILSKMDPKTLSADQVQKLAFIHASNGNKDLLEKLLKHFPDKINAQIKNEKNQTLLHESVRSNNKDCVKLLLDYGVSLKAQDNDGNTPLHIAYALGNLELAQLLEAAGADTSKMNNSGNMPVHQAASQGHKDLVDLWLTEADVSKLPKEGWLTLLICAAEGNQSQLLTKLLQNNTHHVDINERENGLDNALCAAIRNGHTPIVNALLNNNQIDVNVTNREGDTPLRLAISSMKSEILDILMNTPGINKNQVTKGLTPLAYAVLAHNHEALVALGSDPEVADRNPTSESDKTLLHLINEDTSLETVRYLLQNFPDLDVNALDQNNWTPLFSALIRLETLYRNEQKETVTNKFIESIKVLRDAPGVDFDVECSYFTSKITVGKYLDGFKGLKRTN